MRFLCSLLIVIGLASLAPGAEAQTKPLAGPPVKLGVIATLTGPGAAFGADMVSAEKMAVDVINSHGGILGRPLQVVVKDDAADAATGAKLALQLIQEDKVDALIGPAFSSPLAATLPIVNDAHVVQFEESYVVDAANAAKYPYTFKINTTSSFVAASYAAFLKGLKAKSVAILAVNNLQGIGVADGVTANLTKAGIPVVAREMIDQGSSDVTGQLDRLHRAAPSAVILALAYGPDYVAALKGLNQIGWGDAVPIGTSAINFDVVVKGTPPEVLARSYGSGGLKSLTVECETPAVKAFRSTVSAQVYNHGPITQSIEVMALTYDGLLMYAAAANGAKSTSSASVRQYLETHAYDGLIGSYRFTAQSHAGVAPQAIVFVKGGSQHDGLAHLASGQTCN